MVCTDKFGREVGVDTEHLPYKKNGSDAKVPVALPDLRVGC